MLQPSHIFSEISELRIGVDGRLSVIAHGRREKPSYSELCIFCPESRHTLDVAYLEDARRGIYVVRNRFPIVSQKPEGRVDLSSFGIFGEVKPAYGTHVVIIDSDKHDLDPFADSSLTEEYYRNWVWASAETIKKMKEEGYMWGAIGKNRNGPAPNTNAGASQEHPHSQGVAMEIPSRHLRESRESYKFLTNSELELDPWTYGQVLRGCTTCLTAYDSVNTQRQIYRSRNFVSFIDPTPDEYPWDKQFKIRSLSHISSFASMEEKMAGEFAEVLHRTMVEIGRLFPGCGFNFALREGFWHYEGLDPRVDHFGVNIYLATPENERRQGIIPHIIGASVLTMSPEEELKERRKNIQ